MKAGRESAAVGNRGVGKNEGSCGRVRGRRSLWALEGSYITFPPSPISTSFYKALPCPQCHHFPTTPQGSTGPKVSDPAGQATGPASPAALSALLEAIPAHMQHLQIQVGGIKQVYKCWVEGCKEDPSTSWATICADVRKVYLGVRLVCSLCSKTFFNLDILRCHKKFTSINKIRGIITWEFYRFWGIIKSSMGWGKFKIHIL